MSLIWRSIFNVEGADGEATLLDSAESIFAAWCKGKCHPNGVELPVLSSASGGKPIIVGDIEFTLRLVQDEGVRIFRGTCFEDRQGERVKTTFTAIDPVSDLPTAWIDLERWSDEPYGQQWLPVAPGFVSELISRNWTCLNKASRFRSAPFELRGADRGVKLGKHLIRDTRTVPVVVVTPTNVESNQGNLQPAVKRGQNILKRVLGIASVMVLDADAALSLKEYLDENVGPNFHTVGGSVRTYWPGLKLGDRPIRHRFQGYQTVTAASTDGGSLLVAPQIIKGSTEQSPPEFWSKVARPLLDSHEGQDAEELLEEIIQLETELEKSREDARALKVEHEEILDDLMYTQEIAEDENAGLRKVNEQLRAQIRTVGSEFDPDLAIDGPWGLRPPESCADLLALLHRLETVQFPQDLWKPTRELDSQDGRGVYAKQAWAALLAMEHYAQRQGSTGFNGDFQAFCKEFGDIAISPSKVIMRESETTSASKQMRADRTFHVAGNEVFMESHIRIGGGKPPAPRLYFFDDTKGETAKVHIGYFGEHLQTKSTN